MILYYLFACFQLESQINKYKSLSSPAIVTLVTHRLSATFINVHICFLCIHVSSVYALLELFLLELNSKLSLYVLSILSTGSLVD